MTDFCLLLTHLPHPIDKYYYITMDTACPSLAMLGIRVVMWVVGWGLATGKVLLIIIPRNVLASTNHI